MLRRLRLVNRWYVYLAMLLVVLASLAVSGVVRFRKPKTLENFEWCPSTRASRTHDDLAGWLNTPTEAGRIPQPEHPKGSFRWSFNNYAFHERVDG